MSTLLSMGIMVCFPLGTKEIPKGPQKPSANRDQVLGSPTRLPPHRGPGFCCWKEYQNEFQKNPRGFCIGGFQRFLHPGMFQLGSTCRVWHHRGFCSVQQQSTSQAVLV